MEVHVVGYNNVASSVIIIKIKYKKKSLVCNPLYLESAKICLFGKP